MSSNDKVVVIFLVCLSLGISVPASVYYYRASQVAIEAAKNGLQECLVKGGSYGQTAWQKECEK